MQTEDVKARLISQLKEFLTYTIDTDDDTIVSQYTLIKGLVDQLASGPDGKPAPSALDANDEFNADYDYFLGLNTLSSQPANRKMHALEGLQERFRSLLSSL
jgi:hypothetical protein